MPSGNPMRTPPNAPVLLIIFNRPDTTQMVFDAIRRAQPPKLYVSADGPRPENKRDSIDCAKAREVVKKVDWSCKVQYRFLATNLDCGAGVSSAISWAFENEDRLIILEDDCVPSLPFFSFSNYCLEKFAADSRVWVINSLSPHPNHPVFKTSDYVFSKYEHCGGWATWKRAWSYFDISMKLWPDFNAAGGFLNCSLSTNEARFFTKLYAKLYHVHNLGEHSWAYPFSFTFMSNDALAITPSKTLTRNVGYYGVHSKGRIESYHLLDAAEDFTFTREPSFVLRNRSYDIYHFNHYIRRFGTKPLYYRAIRKALKLLGIIR